MKYRCDFLKNMSTVNYVYSLQIHLATLPVSVANPRLQEELKNLQSFQDLFG